MEKKQQRRKNRISKKKVGLIFLGIFLIGILIPQNLQMPVIGASQADYNKDSYWFYPWGKSITHKGVDIFGKKGQSINSATKGMVLYTGKLQFGGNIVIILGPKWRIHYYAHLNEIKTRIFSFVSSENMIGTVGDSGNAAGKQPHLHYAIVSAIPYPWRIDKERQGWKKAFYLNPIDFLDR